MIKKNKHDPLNAHSIENTEKLPTSKGPEAGESNGTNKRNEQNLGLIFLELNWRSLLGVGDGHATSGLRNE